MAFARACGCRGLKRDLLPPLCVATFPVFPGAAPVLCPAQNTDGEKTTWKSLWDVFPTDAASSSSPPGTLFQKGQGRMLRLVGSRSISSSALRLLQLWWHRGGREVAKWRSIKVTVAHCSCCCDGFGAGACDPSLKSWSSPRSSCPCSPLSTLLQPGSPSRLSALPAASASAQPALSVGWAKGCQKRGGIICCGSEKETRLCALNCACLY